MRFICKIALTATAIIIASSSLSAQSASAAQLELGSKIYHKRCLGCHGPSGDVPAFGISRKLTEIPPQELRERLTSYLDRSLRGVGGATGTMHKQTTAITREEFDAVLAYVLDTVAGTKIPPK